MCIPSCPGQKVCSKAWPKSFDHRSQCSCLLCMHMRISSYPGQKVCSKVCPQICYLWAIRQRILGPFGATRAAFHGRASPNCDTFALLTGHARFVRGPRTHETRYVCHFLAIPGLLIIILIRRPGTPGIPQTHPGLPPRKPRECPIF